MKKIPTDPVEIAELARSALFAKFGYESFRPWQEEVVVSILSGKDTMYVAKTGGGKSACFQIPAMLLPGTTVVISPLVALMKDQVESLEKRGIRATYLNSTVSEEEYRERSDNLESGAYKMLYISPEKFNNDTFRDRLKAITVPLFAIDEMDCIVSYGASGFRDSFLEIGKNIAEFEYLGKRPPIAAFTATADANTKKFVSETLGMENVELHVGKTFGDNLSIEAMRYLSDADKKKDFAGTMKRVVKDLEKTGGVGIIFASTKDNVDGIHRAFLDMGVEIGKYHAGHAVSRRESNYARFMSGKFKLMVCTNAFWRGIDKPDVRFVVHYGIPSSIQDYVQEIGRGWRDGKESKALMFVSGKDIVQRKFAMSETREAKAAYQEMIAFLDSEDRCRREIIEESFGNASSGKCGKCDFCAGKEYVGKFSSEMPALKKKAKRAPTKKASATSKPKAKTKAKTAKKAPVKKKASVPKKPAKKAVTKKKAK